MQVSEEIQSLIPYVPGKPIDETKREYGVQEVVKLASNENPIGPSKKVLDAVAKAAKEIHRYPDAGAYHIRGKCSEFYGVSPEQIVFGNGSNELIDLLIRVFCEPGESIVTSKAAFFAYKICAQAARVKTVELDCTPDLCFDFDALERFIDEDRTEKHKIIFIPNPNNPTGTYVGAQRINQLLEKVGGREDLLIVFDEAYNEFVRHDNAFDSLAALAKYSNVIVFRTLSKVYGLAALRIGIMFSSPQVADYVNRVRMPFNVSSIAQEAAIAALEDGDYLARSQKVVWQGLDYFYQELDRLGLPYTPSQGNFVLFDTLNDGKGFSEELLKRGVILRPMKGYGLPRHLRMSVGLADENQKAIDAIEKTLIMMGRNA